MMKSSYARLFLLLALQVGLISGCGKLEAVKELATVPEPVVVEHGTTKAQEEGEKTAEEAEAATEPGTADTGNCIGKGAAEKSCSGEGNLYFCLCGRNPLDGG